MNSRLFAAPLAPSFPTRVAVYTLDGPPLSAADAATAAALLGNPVSVRVGAEVPFPSASAVVHKSPRPGVADPRGRTAGEVLSRALGRPISVFASECVFFAEDAPIADANAFAKTYGNPLVELVRVLSPAELAAEEPQVPRVNIHHAGGADSVPLTGLSDEALTQLSKKGIPNTDGSRRGPLGLSVEALQTIRDHFAAQGRDPTDVELEGLAQGWSEHCRHTIFASPIDEVPEGLFKKYIQQTTKAIRQKKGDKDNCVSIFSDNAGGIAFDDDWVVCDKVETHNSPSALDPFGGSITGIVGVNRDVLGFGRGARPIANRYGFCVGEQKSYSPLFRDDAGKNPMLPPERILNGIVEGVESGGNESGIPTPLGFVQVDQRYAGKPLVFVGTVGLIPRTVAGRPSWQKGARPGDRVIVAGGAVGADGIHGATMSSATLDEDSPATAVQIGDPIVQKRLGDALTRGLRDMVQSVHDLGAGGLSCAVSEMGGEAGGFDVELEKSPRKYPGLSPWEVWISESQERMLFAVAPEDSAAFIEGFARQGVVASDLGEFTATGRGVVRSGGQVVMDLDLEFLHEGWPRLNLKSAPTPPPQKSAELPSLSANQMLEMMLARPNFASLLPIASRFDHSVGARSVAGPLVGPGQQAARGAAIRPVPTSNKTVTLSHALRPRLAEICANSMAQATVIDAVAECVALGADPQQVALLDNFCWPSGLAPERLGQLHEACRGMARVALGLAAPFVSGKDSMFNDFSGFNQNGEPVHISALPTLLISAIGISPHWQLAAASFDAKSASDHCFVLGATKPPALAGGALEEALLANKLITSPLPGLPTADLSAVAALHQQIFETLQECPQLFSALGVISTGGIAFAVARAARAGGFAVPNLNNLGLSPAQLFSESAGRFLAFVPPHRTDELRARFPTAQPLAVALKTS